MKLSIECFKCRSIILEATLDGHKIEIKHISCPYKKKRGKKYD